MEPEIIAILLLILFIVILIVAFILFFLIQKRRWEKHAEDLYNKGKDESTEIIRRTFDTIHLDKEKYSSMSEKDLLVEAMLAFGGYGRRLDRIEEKTDSLLNYREYMAGMNEQLNLLSQNVISLQNLMQITTNEAEKVKYSSQSLSSCIEESNQKLGNIDELRKKSIRII